MACFVFTLLLLAMAGHSSATWCVCKEGMGDGMLQKTLDYACGAGADCNPTHQSGPCFNPNTVRAHCNYAVNSYFQRNRQQPTACDFSGTATIVNSDPSTAGCMYPASASATTTTTPISGTTTTVPNNGGSPLVTTPNSGVIGGANNGGLGPPGFSNGNDFSHGGITLLSPTTFLFIISSSIVLATAVSR